ncbi:MAG: TIGR00282 family metallophosphoesterase [Hyphomicrobium sp.]|nr:TIGR00282 family metallophosphoesterase [Hyphomicrobium sp.]
MRLLFLGDIVGRPGRTVVCDALPGLIAACALDLVIINGENAAGGFGITEAILGDLLDAGADCITLGNHAFDQKETLVYIERQERLIRPLNFPKGTPGRGATLVKAKNGADVLVINAMGRVFMTELDCPFRAIDSEITACKLKSGADAIFIDFHAEATSEKQALGYFVDGRVSAVVGTHTHTPTSDYRVLPGGTGYMSDAGMCGDYNSVLGMDMDEPINRFLTKIPRQRFEPATGPGSLSGFAVDIDDATGLASQVAALRQGPHLPPAMPEFWLKTKVASPVT